MKMRVAMVGQKAALQMMKEVAVEYTHLESVFLAYDKYFDASKVIGEHQHSVDLWIFADAGAYQLAKKTAPKLPCFLIEINGGSLMKVLLESGYKNRESLEYASIDMPNQEAIEETFDELGIPSDFIHSLSSHRHMTEAEVLFFHENLYRIGSVSVCFTSMSEVYTALQDKKIPAYLVSPAKTNIRSAINMAIQYWKTILFEQSQLTVILVNLKQDEKAVQAPVLSYEAHKLDLELQATILSFTEEISGALITLGNGQYMVFTTRGSFKNVGKQCNLLLERLALISELPANVGIGYGDTVLAAEDNARLALIHAQNYDEYCAFAVDHNREVEGPLKDKFTINFGFRNENKEIGFKLKQSGVSITTFNKILSVQKSSGKHAVTANEVATWLKMTERNARRILNDLTKTGVAKIVGEEAPASRGRPRKVYRVGAILTETRKGVVQK